MPPKDFSHFRPANKPEFSYSQVGDLNFLLKTLSFHANKPGSLNKTHFVSFIDGFTFDMKSFNLLLLLSLFAFYALFAKAEFNSSVENGVGEEQRLLKFLKAKLPQFSPPQDMTNKTVTLFVDIRQILDISEKEGIITMSLACVITYHSKKAQWEPEDFGGLDSIMVPSGTFWSPDIGRIN